MSRRCSRLVGAVLAVAACAPAAPAAAPFRDARKVLPAEQWRRVDSAVQRALAYLLRQQEPDGSFRTESRGQPGVSSLAIMAFLSVGHSPGQGPHADRLHRAVDFCLDCQQPNGLLALHATARRVQRYNSAHTAYYNHGITGLMLGEAYGMTRGRQNERIGRAMPLAIDYLVERRNNKRHPGDRGGFRYAHPHIDHDADMSCTAWQLMLMRSAKNAAFDVPDAAVDDAVAYVERCWDPRRRVFVYGLRGSERYVTGGSVGGAIVSLAMAGKHETEMARRGVRWLLDRPVEQYACPMGMGNNYHYGVYYGCQATFQLGGEAWASFYPRAVLGLLSAQLPDGSWPPERSIASPYGSVYTTALAVLSLTPPYQLLPIYQR